MEQGRARQLPDRDHRATSSPTRTKTATPLVDKILDTAGQKGTGKWTGISSLDLGMPVTLIAEAVYARCLSAHEGRARRGVARCSTGPKRQRRRRPQGVHRRRPRRALRVEDHLATRRATCCCARPRRSTSWNLNYGGIALMWRGGCIIRSRVPRQDQGGLRQESAARRTCCSTTSSASAIERVPGRPGGSVDRHGGRSTASRCRRSRTALAFYDGYRTRAAAGEPAAGAARLLRRAHLRAHRQAARRVLPHQLDRPRRPRLLRHLQRLIGRSTGMNIRSEYPRKTARSIFFRSGALVHRLDPGIIPFRKAHECQIHVSGGEFNCAANLADCFRPEDRRRHRDGRLPDRRSDRRARPGDGREAVLQAVQAQRRERPEHGDRLQRPRPRRPRARRLLQPRRTKPARCSSPATSTGRRSSAAACAGSTAAASSRRSRRPPAS